MMPYRLPQPTKLFILNKISKHIEVLAGLQGIFAGMACLMDNDFQGQAFGVLNKWLFGMSVIFAFSQIIAVYPIRALRWRHWSNLANTGFCILIAYIIYIHPNGNLLGVGGYLGLSLFCGYCAFITETVRLYNKKNQQQIEDDNGEGVF